MIAIRQKEKINVRIDHMIGRRMKEGMEIEKESFEFPWTRDEFARYLDHPRCIGMIAEQKDGKTVGFILYEEHSFKFHIANLAVSPPFRRQGIASQMIASLISALGGRRTKIMFEVRETNLGGQLFLKKQGFIAVDVYPKFYGENDESAYFM